MKVTDDESVITGGDVVTLRVEPIKDNQALKFDQNGCVASQQVVKLVFLKNGVVVRAINFCHYVPAPKVSGGDILV